MKVSNRLRPRSTTAVGTCALLGLIAAVQYTLGAQQPPEPRKITADYTVEVPAGHSGGELTVTASKAGEATILVRGLSLGGAVQVKLGARDCGRVELLATKGLQQGKADAALVTASLGAGENRLAVAEQPGAQIVRAAGTNLWFGTTSESAGHAMFSVDFDRLGQNKVEYPVTVYLGPEWKPFCWFSGKFDRYHGDSYTEQIADVSGSSGPQQAVLRYTAVHPPRKLVMPMEIALVRAAEGGTFALRVRQVLRATGEPAFGGNLEFLHLVINPKYGHDWEDGVPDYVWYRAQREDAPDTLPGSHTTLVRMDDNSLRSYPYPASTSDPGKIARSGSHHTGAAVAMEAVNTVGGWFTKTGAGCVGLVFHRYKANFRDDLVPLHSHCGDGADTHHYVLWGELFNPLGMKKAGDQVEIEYSLWMLPSEPLHTDVEDLNEADLHFFGKEKEQKSQITGWTGTKQAMGLVRSDGSIILLGLGTQPGRVKVPEATRSAAKRAFAIFDLRSEQYRKLEVTGGTVEVRPRSVTVIDCGSALRGPKP